MRLTTAPSLPGKATAPGDASSGRLRRRCRPRLARLEDRTLLSSGTDSIPARAQVLTLTAGVATQSGSIDDPDDVDLFRFDSPVTGQVGLSHNPGAGSRVKTVATVYDSGQHVLASDDPQYGGLGLDDPSGFRAVEGRTYLISIGAADGASLGAYILKASVHRDDFGNTFRDAFAMSTSFVDEGLSGAIDYVGDVDLFRFVAPATTRLTIALHGVRDNTLVGSLAVFDGARNLLSAVDAATGADAPDVGIDIIRGRTYSIEVAASARANATSAKGGYAVRFTPATVRQVGPNDRLGTAIPLAFGFPVVESLAAGDVGEFKIAPTSHGRLVAEAHSPGDITRLSLRDVRGQVLMQSDGAAPGLTDESLDLHLHPGAYYLEVENLGGAGDIVVKASFTATISPPAQMGRQIRRYSGIGGDFNGDRIPDLVLGDGVHLGVGDGTFRGAPPSDDFSDTAYSRILASASGDFDGDGRLDLAVANTTGDLVLPSFAILLGNGDGTFRAEAPIALDPSAIESGDFDGDGRLDLAVVNAGEGSVTILLGDGHGNFRAQAPIRAGKRPFDAVPGDFDDDGRLDLAVVDEGEDSVTVLLGDGHGRFRAQAPIRVGKRPFDAVPGDFDGDGRLDLAVVDEGEDSVTILSGKGDGSFRERARIPVGRSPIKIVSGDFDGDRLPDLAVANGDGGSVTILLGDGDGTFRAQAAIPGGDGGVSDLAALDFDGDQRADLAVVDRYGAVTLRLGRGDGTFQAELTIPVGTYPGAIAAEDFNGDGKPDLAVANSLGNSVTILAGNGDGSYRARSAIPVGAYPSAIATEDFNGDGRVDLAVANGDGSVTILLGNGDGSFRNKARTPIGEVPSAIVSGDSDGDGRVDLAVPHTGGSSITILSGTGDGSFRTQAPVPARIGPSAIVAGDFDDDGRDDLAVADGDGFITILLSNGRGTFRARARIPVAGIPNDVVSGDFDGDGRLDLAVADESRSVTILSGNGDGSFRTQAPVPARIGPSAIVAGDFDGDGRDDLAVADGDGGSVTILLSNGRGTFRAQAPIPVGRSPSAMVAYDVNDDGKVDLAVVNRADENVSVLVNAGSTGGDRVTLVNPDRIASNVRNTPVIADFDGDGTEDIAVVNSTGEILYRHGRSEQPGTFDPPIIVNPARPARDIGVVDTSRGLLLVAVAARDNAVKLSTFRDGGIFEVGMFATGSLPEQVAVADLTGDGNQDFVVRDAGDGLLLLFYGDGNGGFQLRFVIPAGLGTSDFALQDVDQDGRCDIVFSNQVTGVVGVMRNQGDGVFGPPTTYRAGSGLYDVTTRDGSTTLSTREATAGVAVVASARGGQADLVAINPGSNTVGLLAGLGGGRFANPVALPTPSPTTVVRVADLDDDGLPDLVLLDRENIRIAFGDGDGGFSPQFTTLDAGLDPTGLTIADLDGHRSLIVSNSFGDALVLLGDGRGNFRTPKNIPGNILLAVPDHSGGGTPYFIYSNQDLDHVVVHRGGVEGVPTEVIGDRTSGILAPGAVALKDLDGNSIPDLIVVNGGGNNVLVYPGLGNGQFGPALNRGRGFATGTDPVGITVADLGTGRQDLVIANKGSNDVSILLNQPRPGGGFTFVPGVRLKAGNGPVSTSVQYAGGGNLPQILVSNSLDDTVTLIPGVGGGFFDDTRPTVIRVGKQPGPLIPLPMPGLPGRPPAVVAVNQGSDDVTLITGFEIGPLVTQTFPSGGVNPVAAFAVDLGGGVGGLVIANNGDGRVAVLQVSLDGLVSSPQLLIDPRLPNPTALAFSAFASGVLEFYAVTEGRESAFLEAISLSIITPPGPGEPETPGGGQGTASLLPLAKASLPLISTLLILTLDPASSARSELDSEGQGMVEVASFLGPASASPGQSLLSSAGPDEESGSGEVTEETPESVILATQGGSSWQRYFLGVDEALDHLRDEIGDALLAEAEAAQSLDPSESPLEDLLAFWAPAVDVWPDNRAENLPDEGRGPEDRDRTAAVDMALEMLGSGPGPDTTRPAAANRTSEAGAAGTRAIEAGPLSSGEGEPGGRVAVSVSLLVAAVVSGRFVFPPRSRRDRRFEERLRVSSN